MYGVEPTTTCMYTLIIKETGATRVTVRIQSHFFFHPPTTMSTISALTSPSTGATSSRRLSSPFLRLGKRSRFDCLKTTSSFGRPRRLQFFVCISSSDTWTAPSRCRPRRSSRAQVTLRIKFQTLITTAGLLKTSWFLVPSSHR
jgi:hypothetical protein